MNFLVVFFALLASGACGLVVIAVMAAANEYWRGYHAGVEKIVKTLEADGWHIPSKTIRAASDPKTTSCE